MSPAEKLSKATGRKPGQPKNVRKRPWLCHAKELRTALDLTLVQVATELGVSVPTLHRIESGTEPRLAVALKMAAFYGKPVGEIWRAK